LSLLRPVASTQAVRLLEAGDAYIDTGSAPDSWIIGNAGIQFSIALNKDRTLTVEQIASPQGGRNWLTASVADLSVNVGGTVRTLGARDFKLDGVNANPRESGLDLAINFHNDADHLAISRHFACYPGSPIIESWTMYSSLDNRSVPIRDLNAFDLPLRSATLRWLTGLQTLAVDGGSFTITTTDLQQPLTIGSTGRATEHAVPWFALDDGSGETLFGGLLWPGAWSAHLSRTSDGVHATFGLTSFSTAIGTTPLESPHGYIAVARIATQSVAQAMGAFIASAIRKGRPYSPLVTYNTWFAYGTDINEASMMAEMDSAANLGVELFVLDAGWYKTGTDFATGLGDWEADPDRFPSGLSALSDHAHELGMKFGLWVEPERVDLQTVGRPGLARERWLATQSGRYDPSVPNSGATVAQLCLGSTAAREWILGQLTSLIDAARPDYLKWDNNFWINCNRSGHDHGPEDGNFTHVSQLRQLLATLRERYPDLMIENCSQGGNRLEPSMLASSDTAWMADTTSSSTHVRHNLEGLSALMPPAILLSFVSGNEWADDPEYDDLSTAFRSRMLGILGGTWRHEELDDGSREGMRQEIALYKALRDDLADASARLLTAQVQDEPTGGWDAVQAISTSGRSVLFAFENPGAGETTTIFPEGLGPDVTYDVISKDTGTIGRAQGDELMSSGVTLFSAPGTRAHILEFRPTIVDTH
jgi:alpha-galactosidase